MSTRVQIKRTVNQFNGKKLDCNPLWVTDGVFQHPDNPDNQFNGEEVEDATVDRTWKVMVGDDVIDPDFKWFEDFTFDEGEYVEAMFNGNFDDFTRAFRNDERKAQRVCIHMLLRRRDPATAKKATGGMKMSDFAVVKDDIDVADPEKEEDPSSGAPDASSPSESDDDSTPEPSPTTSE